MKGFFVFFLATAIASVSKANDKSILDIHRGWNTSNIQSSRIIEGHRALLGQFPYHVRLVMSFGTVGASCGGSIIAPNWVLTAAHCIVFIDILGLVFIPYTSGTIEAGSVVAGSASAQKRTVDLGGGYPHPEFNRFTRETLVNDIGILYTAQAFVYSRYVQPITLVDYNPNADKDIYVNQVITVSGFGYTSNNGPVSTNLMYTLDLKGILFSDCEAQINSNLPPTSFCVQDKILPVSAICSGDSGGPGILNGKQVGVVSYASSAGCNTACQGFTRVALYTKWIMDTMAARSTL